MNHYRFIENWVALFNNKNTDALAELYSPDAINHQVANETIVGKENIHTMFTREFAQAEMVCLIEKIYSDGEWAILEWRDPLGLRGCSFFHIIDQKIVFQRGYWDQLSFLRQHKLPIPQK
jgi:limonene-1,2-epoxide hydrolase